MHLVVPISCLLPLFGTLASAGYALSKSGNTHYTTIGAFGVRQLRQKSSGGPFSAEAQACSESLPSSSHSSEDDDDPLPQSTAVPGERVRMPAYGDMEYQLFLPPSWENGSSKTYPVVVFLHGMGDGKFSVMNSQSLPRLLTKDQSTSFDSRKCWCLESDYEDAEAYDEAPPTDNRSFVDSITKLKSPMADCGFAGQFEAIVVMPQGWLPDNPTGWTDEKRVQLEHLVKHTMITYRGDPTRVVLTGQSMGGDGAWMYGAERSELWSAVNVICAPYASSKIAKALSAVPVWVVGWKGDGEAGNDQMVEYLKASSEDADRVHYTRYFKAPGPPDPKYRTMFNHASYDLIYRDPRLWEWAFAQKRQSAKSAWASIGDYE